MSLILPGGKPTNLHLRPDQAHMVVDNDLYNICNRIKEEVEGGERLFILYHEDHPEPFAVMEDCADGVARYVTRTDVLDARLLEKLRYLIKVPFHDRIKELDRKHAKEEADAKAERMEKLYQDLGEPMLHQFHKDGFSESFKSYPKVRGGKKQ